jgi:hypothetical protein
MENCYVSLDLLSNRGGLLLVSPEFYPFSHKLVNAVAAELTEARISLHGKKAFRQGRQAILCHKDLKSSFTDFCAPYKVQKALTNKLWKALIHKVCNARFSAVLKVHKDRTTGRAGSKRSDMALRAERKAESKKPKKSEQQAKRKPVPNAATKEPPQKKAKPEDKLETPKKSNDGAAE